MNPLKTHRESFIGRLSSKTKIGAFSIAAFCLGQGIPAHAQTIFTSTVDEPTGRPWIGFGYNQNPLDRDSTGSVDVTPWSPNHWTLLSQRMAALNPAVVRIMLNQEYFNPAHVAGNYTWNSPEMQAVYQVFDWYKANDIPILTGPWSLVLMNYGNTWPFGSEENNANWLAAFQSAEYAQVCADLMYYLRVVKGYTNIKYFTPQNEPRGTPNLTYAIYNNCINNLTSAFLAQGLPTSVITGPDSWAEFIYEAAKFSSQSIHTYENHAYTEPSTVVTGELEQMFRGMYGASIYQYDNTKPGMLGEAAATTATNVDLWYQQNPLPVDAGNTYLYGLNTFDYGIQVIRSGQSSALLWSLDGYGYGGYANGKDAGMWSWCTSNPLLGGSTLRPHFYTWALLTNYFPQGMRTYRMTQPAGNSIRIVSAQQLESDGSSHWSIAIINQSASPATITVQIPGWAGGTFDQFTYSSASHGDGSSLSLPSTPVSTDSLQNNGVVVSVPAQGCMLLTTLNRTSILPVSSLADPLNEEIMSLSESQNIIASAVGGATTVCLSDSSDGSMVYEYANPSGLTVNAIGGDGNANGRIRVYTSADNLNWAELSTANSEPVDAGGSGYWVASTYSNDSSIPVGTRYIKILLVNDGTGWKTHVDSVAIHPGQNTFFDPLNDLSKCESFSNIGLDNSQPHLLMADASRAYPGIPGSAALVYNVNNFSDFKVRVFGYNSGGALSFYASPDGVYWAPIPAASSKQRATMQSWFTFYYAPVTAVPAGMNYLKIEFPVNSYWATQIGDVEIHTSRELAVMSDPLWDAETMFSNTNLDYLNKGFSPLLETTNLFCPANDTDDAVMVYRYPNVGSFDIKVFGADMNAENKVQVFGSPDNITWAQIPTLNSPPYETDGYWVDSHYTPSGLIAANTNFLKIVLVNTGVGWKTVANSVTIYPSALSVTSATTAQASNGGAFSYRITGDGRPTAYTAYGLPPGLVLDPGTGLITGTSTATGTYSVTIGATSALGIGTETLTITVLPQPPVITSTGTATATKASAFSYQIAANNNPISYGASGLPAGLTLNPGTGLISGTPTVSGTFQATVSAVNAGGTGSAALTITVISTDPPSPWLTAIIGNTGLVGSVSYSSGVYTVGGAGLIGSTQDAERFVYQPLTGDGSIVARISTLGNTGTTAARVGIQIRETLAANSRTATLAVNGSGAFKWMRRSTTGGNTSSTNSSSGIAPNIWIRLTRAGNVITASRSTNGTSWTNIGSATITMASNCNIGLAVGSGSPASINTSVFANVTVVP